MARLVASRYARGLFELALETNQLDIISSSLIRLKNVTANDEFRLAISHPLVDEDEKYAILKNCVPEDSPDELLGFLRLLSERGRTAILSEIIDEFEKLKDEREGIVRARVVSAEKLAEAEHRRIRLMLMGRFKKNIVLIEEINPSIIAGFKVYVGDDLIDSSVKKDIDDIRACLKNLI